MNDFTQVTQLFTKSHWAHYLSCFGLRPVFAHPRQGEIVLDKANLNDVRYSAWSIWTGECTHCHSLSGAHFLLEVIAARFPVTATPAWHKAEAALRAPLVVLPQVSPFGYPEV